MSNIIAGRGVEADVEFDIITCAMPRAKGASPSRSLNKRNEVIEKVSMV